MNETLKKIFILLAGTFLLAVATNYFYVPYDLASGGVSGLAIILNKLIPGLSVGIYITIGNAILFIVGIILLGRTFGVYTIFGAFSYSTWVMILETVAPIKEPLTESPEVSMVIGALLTGVGIAIVFLQNASTGGTDIIAMIFKKYMNIPLSKGMFIIDGLVVVMSAFAFSVNKSLFAILAIILQSLVLDEAITGADRRIAINIISNKSEEINNYIIHQVVRGTTIYIAKGGYSGLDHSVITAIVTRAQYLKIKNYVESVDPKAFIYTYAATEVTGEGFTYRPEKLGAEKIEKDNLKESAEEN